MEKDARTEGSAAEAVTSEPAASDAPADPPDAADPADAADPRREIPLGHWLVDPRLTPRPRPRRAAILDAALELFNEAGFARTSIQDIAQRAEASVGSIYHHFGGKEQIAAALYVESLRAYQRTLLAELQQPRAGAEEAVKALVANHLRWVERERERARFLLTSRDPAVVAASEPALEDMNQRVFDTVQVWIERWAGAGAIRRMPFNLFHSVVLGPSQEFARHWVAGRVKESIDEAAAVLADAAWRAVRA